jgi:hypothetical protein
MTATSDTTAMIQNNGQSMCVTVLAGPATRFSQTNQFSVNPTGSRALQWHGKFYSTTKLPGAEFITLLNVGCTKTTASATKTNGVWQVAVGTTQVTIDNGGVAVGAPAPAPSPPPPTATTSKPYTGTPIAVPATFEAENFDFGGEGIAYHDTTKGNAGGLYRTGEDVDIVQSCDAAGGGYVVNNLASGEWLNYSIKVPTSGNYTVAVKASNNYTSGAFHMEVDGVNVTGSLGGLKTGNWCTFNWFGKSVPLTAGVHVLRLYVDQQYFNVNQIRVTSP